MKRKYILICILFFLFIINTILVLQEKYVSFDNNIYNYLINFRSSNLDSFFKTITQLADPISIVIIIFILLIFLNKENIYRLLISTIFIVSTNHVLKYLFKLVRPEHLRLVEEKGFTYPSGHAMISIGIYGLLIYIVCRYIKNKFIKIVLTMLLFILIILIGISRVYLGVHNPSDIIGGYLMALVILLLVNTLLSNHFRGNKNDKDGGI